MKRNNSSPNGSVHLPEPKVGDLVTFIIPSKFILQKINDEWGLLLSIDPGTGLGRILWSGSNLIERHSLSMLRKVENEEG